MKFEEALVNLRDNKIARRNGWIGKILEFSGGKLVLTSKKYPERKIEEWNPTQEDLIAEDWELIDPDDIKRFYLSAKQLKELGVTPEAIEKLENENVIPVQILHLNPDDILDPKAKEWLTGNINKQQRFEPPQFIKELINK